MSNKDVRKPAPGAADDYWAKRKADILEVVKNFNEGKIPIRDVSDPAYLASVGRAASKPAAQAPDPKAATEAKPAEAKPESMPAQKPAEPEAAQKPAAKAADPDEERLASMTPKEREAWKRQGYAVRDSLENRIIADKDALDDNAAMDALDVCTQFLKQLVMVVTGVMETVDISSMRQIVAAETSLPRDMKLALKAAGVEVGDKPKEPGDRQDWRKRPRGARHPLMVLIAFGVQATRLIQKITAGTNPGSQNLATKEEKQAANDDGSVTLKIPGLPGL